MKTYLKWNNTNLYLNILVLKYLSPLSGNTVTIIPCLMVFATWITPHKAAPEEINDKIFERNFTIEGSQDTGIELPETRQHIRTMNNSLIYKDIPGQKGAIFVISLPIKLSNG